MTDQAESCGCWKPSEVGHHPMCPKYVSVPVAKDAATIATEIQRKIWKWWHDAKGDFGYSSYQQYARDEIRRALIDYAASETAALEAERRRLMTQMEASYETEKKDCLKALMALSAARKCTPVEGYGSDVNWAIADLCRAVTELDRERKVKPNDNQT